MGYTEKKTPAMVKRIFPLIYFLTDTIRGWNIHEQLRSYFGEVETPYLKKLSRYKLITFVTTGISHNDHSSDDEVYITSFLG